MTMVAQWKSWLATKIRRLAMGLFDFIKSLGKEKVVPENTINSIPTITPERELFECFDEVFKREMNNVSGLTTKEKDEIHKLMCAPDGGFLNMGGYHSEVYEKYFKGRAWSWSEYDKWNKTFKQIERWPSRFIPMSFDVETDEALEQLKVAELKNLLNSKGVEFSSSAKKQDLINLAENLNDVRTVEVIKDKIEQIIEKRRFTLYECLMLTINKRSSSLHGEIRSKRAGVSEYKTSYLDEGDKEFVDLALKENPNALPPYFPYDLTFRVPELSWGDEE